MLDLFPTPSSVSQGSNPQMPMDLSQYLLSASPPTSEFSMLGYMPHSHNHLHAQNSLALQNLSLDSPAGSFTSDSSFHHPFLLYQSDMSVSRSLSPINNDKSNSALKPIISKSESSCCESEVDEKSNSENSCPVAATASLGRISKRVTFADHKGFALTQVRVLNESPDEPPQLSPSILSSLTHGACADVTSKPPIKLCFAQPASDYLAFRDKVSHHLVSLENVILRDYSAEGTIKVKNITFEKRVFVRLSLDEWETFEDYEASYVPGLGMGSMDAIDTFSFQMEISPSFDVSKKVQFAVCFSENGKEHWDNNGGDNYCIVSEDYCDVPDSSMPPFSERWLPSKNTDSWTEFSVWRDLETKSPYY